ncbi:MAG: S1C family serine protease, partial [Acidobacteria bacterium]|nr:S1C family serine protease [Acidobacteriota bacterium]
MYRVSARLILTIAFASALSAAGLVYFLDRYGSRDTGAAATAFSEAPPAGITSPATATDEQNNIEVYRTLSPGVVFITSTTFSNDWFDAGERQGTGSGSVIDEQGHILTNNHVVEGASKLTVSFGENSYPATVVGRDPDTDLAVIKVSAPREQLRIVPFGDSDRLVVGQKVLAIGNPFSFARTLT